MLPSGDDEILTSFHTFAKVPSGALETLPTGIDEILTSSHTFATVPDGAILYQTASQVATTATDEAAAAAQSATNSLFHSGSAAGFATDASGYATTDASGYAATAAATNVGTKPTTGQLLTEVELGALLLGYSESELIAGGGLNSGYAIALSKDGKALAVCSTDGVCVYSCDYSGSFTMWGAEILISNTANLSVALSRDGETLAVGNPSYFNQYHNVETGQVRVYQKPSTADAAWVLNSNGIDLDNGIDNGIDGAINVSGNSGSAVAMNSSSTVIAVGAPGIDVGGFYDPAVDYAADVGHVRVWTRESESATTWTQKGSSIVGGAAGDESGTSLALSADGQTVAVGSPKYDSGAASAPPHRYFGLVPTETTFAYEQWFLEGWEIQDSAANNILPASTAEDEWPGIQAIWATRAHRRSSKALGLSRGPFGRTIREEPLALFRRWLRYTTKCHSLLK